MWRPSVCVCVCAVWSAVVDGWCIHEAPFGGLDQGLKASSSQAESGTGGSRTDGGEGRGMMDDGWRMAAGWRDCRTQRLSMERTSWRAGENERNMATYVEGRSQSAGCVGVLLS